MSQKENIELEIVHSRGAYGDTTEILPLKDPSYAFTIAANSHADIYRIKKTVEGEAPEFSARNFIVRSADAIMTVEDAIENLEYNHDLGRVPTAPDQIDELKKSGAVLCVSNGYAYRALKKGDIVRDREGTQIWPREAPKFKIKAIGL